MQRRVIHNEATIEAPQQFVWDAVAHAERWKDWGGFSVARLERVGEPTDDGVGAIRNFGTGPVVSREEVTEFEAPQRLSYRLLSGLPVTDYRSTITITAVGPERCHLDWSSSLANTGVGSAVMRGFLSVMLRSMLWRLQRHARSANADASGA